MPLSRIITALHKPKQKPLTMRWMLQKDIPSVMEIERRSFEFSWPEYDFLRCLRQRNVLGMVADLDDEVVGFMIYELRKTRLRLLNFAVHPSYRRQGVGRTMADKLCHKLSAGRRTRIVLEVRETNLDAQCFFRACGFRAISLLRDFYEDTTEDAYLMQLRHKEAARPHE